jgi:hypothetical protein
LIPFGCSKNNCLIPFDDEGIRLLSVSGKQWITLEQPHSHWSGTISGEQASNLIEKLRPIASTKSGTLKDDDVDYILSFQAGKNPVRFFIRLNGSSIIYSERQFLYEGGNPIALKEIINNIQYPGIPAQRPLTTDKKVSPPSVEGKKVPGIRE